MRPKIWTPELDKKLKELYPFKYNKEIVELLNKSKFAINSRASELGLRKDLSFCKNGRRINWTPELDEKLRTLRKTSTMKQIATSLGMSESVIYIRAKALGLGEMTNRGRFHIGQVPANKGKKIPREQQSEAMRATQFKKGHQPHNTKYDGYISIREDSNGNSYKYIRTAEGVSEHLHIHNYILKHGSIPAGKILRSKDGNQLNCDPDNWEPVTRKEHLELNSGRKDITPKYALYCLAPRDKEKQLSIKQHLPELINIKQSQLKIRRALNEK